MDRCGAVATITEQSNEPLCHNQITVIVILPHSIRIHTIFRYGWWRVQAKVVINVSVAFKCNCNGPGFMATFLLEYIPRWQVPGINQETVGEQTSDVVIVVADREELPHFGPPKLSVCLLFEWCEVHPSHPRRNRVFFARRQNVSEAPPKQLSIWRICRLKI